MATDEAIEQRLGEDPEDESVKERLEREHGELLEELRALIPGAEVLFGFLLAIRFTGQFTDLNAVALRLLRHTGEHGGLAGHAARPLRLPPPPLSRRRQGRACPQGEPGGDRGDGRHRSGLHWGAVPITDLLFTTQAAIGVALVFFALTAWRWWAIALYRKARE